MKNATLTAHLALIAVALIYGSNYVVAKGLMPDVIGPSGFIVLRVYGASLLFVALMGIFKERPKWKDLSRLALCAVFGIAVNQLMFFNGLALTSPINSSIIITMTPILVLPLSVLVLKEKVTMRKGSGILLGFIGAVSLVVLSSRSGSSQVSMLGDLMILINASSYAFYLILVKPLMAEYQPITVISWVFFFGALYVLPFGFTQVTEIDWGVMTTGQFGSMLYVVVMATFIVYFLNVYALGKVSPNVVSSYIYLQPVFTLGFAYLFWHFGLFGALEPLVSWGTFICAALIFIGVWMVSGGRRTL